MRRTVRTAVLLLFLLSLGTLTAFGQFLSGIEGTVRDSSGASVDGAKVTRLTLGDLSLCWRQLGTSRGEPMQRQKSATATLADRSR